MNGRKHSLSSVSSHSKLRAYSLVGVHKVPAAGKARSALTEVAGMCDVTGL